MLCCHQLELNIHCVTYPTCSSPCRCWMYRYWTIEDEMWYDHNVPSWCLHCPSSSNIFDFILTSSCASQAWTYLSLFIAGELYSLPNETTQKQQYFSPLTNLVCLTNGSWMLALTSMIWLKHRPELTLNVCWCVTFWSLKTCDKPQSEEVKTWFWRMNLSDWRYTQ